MRSAQAMSQAGRYFVLVYLQSWGWWGIAAATRKPPSHPLSAILLMAGGLAPSLTGLVMTRRGHPIESERDLLTRTVDPRLIPMWLYVAIPAMAFLPDLLARLVPPGTQGRGETQLHELTRPTYAAVAGLVSGISEELGWRGYALERLRASHSGPVANLLLAAAWSAWHLPLFLVNGTYQQTLGLRSREALIFFASLIPIGVVIGWLYERTDRSVLSAIMLHGMTNAATLTLTPRGRQSVAALVIWIAFAAVAIVIWNFRIRPKPPA
jgi:uncharacterized protein